MNTEHYEVVVVGGGPAGSAAAYTLANANRKVCLIDKAEFPREKLCGGLITLRSKSTFEKIFGRSWKAELFNSSQEISFYANGDFLAPQNGHTRLYFTMRLPFDHYLLGLAHEAGATLKLGETINKIELSRNLITLQSGQELSFDFLIGADGVNSLVAKTLFGKSFDPDTIGFGLEAEVPREKFPQQSETVQIEFGAARWGYGWVFPKQKSFTIGIGGIHRLNPDLRNRFDQYLQRKGVNPNELKVKGQYIPFGDFRKVPGGGNVLLCGDAAGTVDPITGEGIAYAMQTGAAAGSAIVKAASDNIGGNAFAIYRDDYKHVASSLRQANFWRSLIFPKLLQKPFAWAFSDAETLRKGYLDILAGERDYDALYGLFALQTGKAIAKPFKLVWSKLLGNNPLAD